MYLFDMKRTVLAVWIFLGLGALAGMNRFFLWMHSS